jgi:hypothetical protein
MSYTAPIPNWRGQLTGGSSSQTAVNIDLFASYAPLAGAHGLNKLQEGSDFADYDLGYEFKFMQKLKGTAADIFGYQAYGYFTRGYIFGNWIIENAKIRSGRGAVWTITITWQSIGGYLPPDEWNNKAEDLRPHLERHPIFASLQASDFAMVRLAFQAATVSGRQTALNQLQATSNPTLATQLFNKLLQGMEEYYLAGSRYTWSSYYLPGDVPTLSPGGVQYTSVGGPSGYVLPPGYTWLRYADDDGQANYGPLGGIVKLTRTFIGAPNGVWDTDIYPVV